MVCGEWSESGTAKSPSARKFAPLYESEIYKLKKKDGN